MPARNLDSLKVTSLKVWDKFLSSPFWGVNSEVAGLYLFISANLISSLLLFNSKSKKLVVLYSKTYFGSLRGWQYGKAIRILQILTCLIKPLVDLTIFPYLRHKYNLDFIAIIADVYSRINWWIVYITSGLRPND